MSIADSTTYLGEVTAVLRRHWPEGHRTVNVVCHGHSVPAGYFATPRVDTFNAYPHLLHRALNDRFPCAVVNVIVSAIGGEESTTGSERFDADVLAHRPDVVTIDYGLNDRRKGLAMAEAAWRLMIEAALERSARVLLLTPTHDTSRLNRAGDPQWTALASHAEQIRRLADEYAVGLVDSFAEFERYVEAGGDLTDLLSWSNHPNRAGHELVARALLRWFPAA